MANRTTHHSRRKELTHSDAETIRRCAAMLRSAAVMSARPSGRNHGDLSDLRVPLGPSIF